jgi:phosphonate ABC transporter permease subunit PhnE
MTNGLPKHSSKGLTRFFVVLFSIVAIVVTYAFAFQRTDVSLDEIKDEGRRASLVRIIRGIAHPNIIEYDETPTYHIVEFVTPCPSGGFEPTPVDTSGPYLEAVPSCADPGANVHVLGHNFPPGAQGPLSFIPPSGVTLRLASITASQSGEFDVIVKVPDRPDTEIQQMRLTTTERSGSWRLTKTARDTWEKIIETVMLALVATTLGTVAAIPLSFLSARNLMRTIRTPIVSVGLFIVGIPVGLIAGRQVGRWVTAVGSHMATNVALLAVAIAGIGAAAWFALRITLPAVDEEPPTLAERTVRRLVVAAVAIAAMFVLGFTGHLLREVGTHLEDWLGPLGFMGGFFRVIGDVLATFITTVAAVVGAATAAMIGSRIGHIIADRARPAALLAARYVVLSLAAAVIAVAIGGAVHWLYELQPTSNLMSTTAGGLMLGLTAIVMAGRFGRRWFPDRLGLLATLLRLINTLVWVAVGGGLGVLLGIAADRTADALGASGNLLGPAIVGIVLGAIGVSVSRKVHSLPSGMTAYYFARTLFNGIRSVEPLIMAIVFVVWVGIGPFAGALALSLHTTAALAKLYSEQVESISQGPIEAVTATGATRLQSIIYAVVPQIVPPYIAFTLYRWDINVRMSTIIGFAGGGGIGFLLQQNINLLLYKDAAVQMLAIAIVVSTLDFVSARIRERIV